MEGLVALVALLITVLGYVGYVSYRLGDLNNRVANAEADIEELKSERATNTDIANIHKQLEEIKHSLNRLFEKKY